MLNDKRYKLYKLFNPVLESFIVLDLFILNYAG